ncbi:MAG: right-handed parallel beta-helix repeat-containing protein [Kiritimatiellia bacterium]
MASCLAGASPSRVHLTEKRPVAVEADDPRDDLRPGLKLSCRVQFDASPEAKGQMTLVSRGGADEPGAYILRVDGPKEGVKFSFFANVDGSPEPRVSVPVRPEVGAWYDVAAGWDGTNVWLAVNGQRARRPRAAAHKVYPRLAARTYGPLQGTICDLKVEGPEVSAGGDWSIRPGFRIACDAVFRRPPQGETTILHKDREYWLRYDRQAEGPGAFNLFLFLDGQWEPRTSFVLPVETNRVYRLAGGWTGRESRLAVDGEPVEPRRRRGRCQATDSVLRLGTKGVVDVSDVCIRNEKTAVAFFGPFRTRELMPTVGTPARLVGSLRNIGAGAGACTVRARARGDVSVVPQTLDIPDLAEGRDVPLEWTVDAGTNGFAFLEFEVCQAPPAGGRQGDARAPAPFCRADKRIVFMPAKIPDYSAGAWRPPLRPARTFHVDADAGHDGHDGLTPQTAWKTFRNAAGLTLGPGERLLLKRGCAFNEELSVKAAGAADNWAEIGAYGEGMRPQIRRNRQLNERCAYIADAAYLAIRDLIFCNAGSGLTVGCVSPASGHVLVERCLAHHIEGMYRFNSHGIPEWWDEPGPAGGARSYGIAVTLGHPRHVVMRDCETYQCSSGFGINGTDTFVTRMFCHDNYAHNTSPHPYNCASRSWMTDCVFDASGWHAAAGTMGVMLAGNDGWIVRGCHFLNQPDSGSPDQGGIDFEAQGENCLVEACTFRNNAGAAIEVLGLRCPQTRNVQIRGCKFDRNNWAFKNGPAEIQVWGSPGTSREVCCSNGRIEGNGYVLVPGVPFYVNESPSSNDWTLAANRAFDFSEDLDAAFPYADPPAVAVCGEVWTDRPQAALSARIGDAAARVSWEQIEGPPGVTFAAAGSARTQAFFPGVGDYRVNVVADNGTLWRAAHTAVHVLPAGARTFKAWDFARNLDAQGWEVADPGTEYRLIRNRDAFWDTESFPVRLVCGDYFVIAVKDSATAALVSPCDRDVGVEFSAARANAVRIRMQNHTNAARMRLWWQTDAAPEWSARNSVVFAVTAWDGDDSLYTVPMPALGGAKRLKLSFSADGRPVTGTVRIDYIWLGRLP